MKSKYLAISAAIGATIIFFFALRFRQSREPSYQGRSLSSWLQDFSADNTNAVLRAETAVSAMGTNALPFLMDIISAEKSSLREYLENLAEQSPVRVSFLKRNSTRTLEAAAAINALGTLADPAFSSLTNLFYTRHTVSAGIGSKGTQFLINVTTNENSSAPVVKIATLALGEARSDFDIVVPTLITILNTTNSFARVNAATSLGSLHQKSEIAIPALIKNLDDADPLLCNYIISAIGEFGPDAKAAVPILIKAQNSEGEMIRQRATEALQKITQASVSDLETK